MNRRSFLGTAAVPFLPQAAGAQAGSEISQSFLTPRFGDGRDWWFRKRFGMFLHWGLYSIHGFHEQEQWRARVPRAEYAKLQQQWNPVKFDPDAWLDLARDAGMEYVCLTTKHHDGFCLWNTKQTAYNTMNTPYGKDVLKMLADACHRRGVPLCLYYSVVDWHEPTYPNQGRSHELQPQPGDTPDLARYLAFLTAQVRELCTNYGEISGFWWDMNVTGHQDQTINTMIRRLQPNAVINDRGFDIGDFGTPERDNGAPGDPLGFTRRTEACQSVGAESWGYRKDEDYYSDRHLHRSIASYRARDANYLLNVGPMPDGTIAEQPSAILRRIGKWYAAVREAFDDVLPAGNLTVNRNLLLTRKGNTLYVVLHRDPLTEAVKLKPLAQLPRRATLLNDGRELPCTVSMLPSDHTEQRGYLTIHRLPVNEMANTVMVVKLEFDRLA